jgi:predicted Rossmann-fold nucleotide-binding protein
MVIMADTHAPGLTLAVFASDKGPGDAERSSIMSQAGSYFARRGAGLVCLAENGVLPVPLITAARAAGGRVQIIGDDSIVLPPALDGVPLELIAARAERAARVGALADALVALPGSLQSVSALFTTWTAAKANGLVRPVVMLNRHRAFEAVRGYAADVLSHSLPGHDRVVQFSESIEDVWARVSRLVNER